MITQCNPNPINEQCSIKFSVFKASTIELRLFDISGKLQSTLHTEKMPQGKYEIDWNPYKENISKGFYLLSLNVNGLTVHSLKLQIV